MSPPGSTCKTVARYKGGGKTQSAPFAVLAEEFRSVWRSRHSDLNRAKRTRRRLFRLSTSLAEALRPERDHLRHHSGAPRQDHAEKRSCRANQLRYLPNELRIDEAPAIEVHIVQNSEPPGGMGEAGTSAIVPAVANAVFAATRKRLRKLPLDAAALKQPA